MGLGSEIRASQLELPDFTLQELGALIARLERRLILDGAKSRIKCHKDGRPLETTPGSTPPLWPKNLKIHEIISNCRSKICLSLLRPQTSQAGAVFAPDSKSVLGFSRSPLEKELWRKDGFNQELLFLRFA